MSLKQRLHNQLVSTRQLSERLLADFKRPDEWTHQVHAGANHALWFVGHMAHTDNFLISLIDPSRASEQCEHVLQFGMGSQPTNSPSDYPPVEELLERMRARRQTLLAILDSLEDHDLARPTPDGAPDFLADYAAVFEMAIWHERLHCGQLTVVRRALGHAPVSDGQTESASK